MNAVVPLERLEAETVAWCRRDPGALADRAADAEGRLQRRRRRPGRHPAARRRRHDALLHVRRGPRGSQRLRRKTPTRLLPVPAAALTALVRRRDHCPANGWPGPGPAPCPPRWCPSSSASAVADAAGVVIWWRSLFALVVALAIQVGTNYANDYSDGVRGTDAERGRARPPRRGRAGGARARCSAASFYAFAVAGVAGLVLALSTTPWLLAVGARCVAAGWLYSAGPRPYGYAGFGEVFVFVFFGLVAVVGTAYVTTGHITSLAVTAAVPVGLLATALLVVNNLRDIETDKAAGQEDARGPRSGARATRLCTSASSLPRSRLVVVISFRRPFALLALARSRRPRSRLCAGAASAPRAASSSWRWPVPARCSSPSAPSWRSGSRCETAVLSAGAEERAEQLSQRLGAARNRRRGRRRARRASSALGPMASAVSRRSARTSSSSAPTTTRTGISSSPRRSHIGVWVPVPDGPQRGCEAGCGVGKRARPGRPAPRSRWANSGPESHVSMKSATPASPPRSSLGRERVVGLAAAPCAPSRRRCRGGLPTTTRRSTSSGASSASVQAAAPAERVADVGGAPAGPRRARVRALDRGRSRPRAGRAPVAREIEA